MKSDSTIMTARILALAAMFAAVLGVHAFHVVADCSGHESDLGRSDFKADNHAESGTCHDCGDDDSTSRISLDGRGTEVSGESCLVCDFLKTRPVQSCSDTGDLHQMQSPSSRPVVRLHTPISSRHALPGLSRAPPVSCPIHIA